MSIINRLIRLVRFAIKTLCALPTVSEYMENGVYHLENRRLVKGWGFLVLFIYSPRKKQYLSQKATFYWGEWTQKIVFVLDDVVISFYDKRGSVWNQNIASRIDHITYPKAQYLEFNNHKRFNVTQRVVGKAYSDKDHVTVLAKDIIKNNGKQSLKFGIYYRHNTLLSTLGIDEFISVLQHCDATPVNAIWTSSDSYQYIDFDTIAEHPFLYDFFKMWLIHFREAGLDAYISGLFDEELTAFFSDNNIPIERIEGEKDKYLAIFIVFSQEYWNTLSIDFSMLPQTYQLTHKVIRHYHDQQSKE